MIAPWRPSTNKLYQLWKSNSKVKDPVTLINKSDEAKGHAGIDQGQMSCDIDYVTKQESCVINETTPIYTT
jgi:hypothetical protein